jgi:hypothetical protein
VKTLHPVTGIYRDVYTEGRLGDYPGQVEGTERFERQLAERSFNREAGDAVVVVAKLAEPIVVGR